MNYDVELTSKLNKTVPCFNTDCENRIPASYLRGFGHPDLCADCLDLWHWNWSESEENLHPVDDSWEHDTEWFIYTMGLYWRGVLPREFEWDEEFLDALVCLEFLLNKVKGN